MSECTVPNPDRHSNRLAAPNSLGSLWAMVLLLWVLTVPMVHAADVSPAQLVETLLSPDIADQQWHEAEGSFEKLSVEVALRAVYPEVAKGAPGGPIYNCLNPDHDRHVGAWGRYCVANWLWCQTLARGKTNSQAGKALLELWAQPQTRLGQSVLVTSLDTEAWVPEAEEPVRNLFTDSNADSELREQAAACLLHHFGAKYHHDVVLFALFSSYEIRDLLFRELASPPHAGLSEVDPAVVRMGFWLMFEALAKNESLFAHGSIGASYYGTFLFADYLGRYLGENFTPDYKLPKYQSEGGREIWYRNTTENALTWWLKNKERYAS